MLFDLRGRRRRAVQATYLTLAVLMGGGLVFFGIGGDVSGGLFDAFSERGGGGNEQLEERIERNEQRLAGRPRSEAVLKELVRDYYALAASQTRSGAQGFPEEARDELRQAGAYWERYRRAEDGRVDPSLASVAVQLYDVGGLNQPGKAQDAMAVIAQASDDPSSYLQLVAYAAAAGDTRTADLAAQKAVSLAPKGERKQIRRQAERLKVPRQQQGG